MLESKKYIEIIKGAGKVNKYKIIKYNYFNEVDNQKEDKDIKKISNSTSVLEQTIIKAI